MCTSPPCICTGVLKATSEVTQTVQFILNGLIKIHRRLIISNEFQLNVAPQPSIFMFYDIACRSQLVLSNENCLTFYKRGWRVTYRYMSFLCESYRRAEWNSNFYAFQIFPMLYQEGCDHYLTIKWAG